MGYAGTKKNVQIKKENHLGIQISDLSFLEYGEEGYKETVLMDFGTWVLGGVWQYTFLISNTCNSIPKSYNHVCCYLS